MADTPVEAVFFTELDAILDTRMGTIMKVDPDLVPGVIKGGYLSRDRDLFTGVDREKFKELYKTRDKETLMVSCQTPVVWFMRDFGHSIYEQNINTPFLRNPSIVINTYPYQLTEEEKETIKLGIKIKTKHIDKIDLVYMEYKDLTPKYFKKHLHVVWLYEPITWLNIHADLGTFDKDTCPNVDLFGPLIIDNLDNKTVNVKKDFGKFAETLARYFVNLHLVEPYIFSADIMVRKTNDEEKTEEKA